MVVERAWLEGVVVGGAWFVREVLGSLGGA